MRNDNYKWFLLFFAVLLIVGSIFDHLSHVEKMAHEERMEMIRHGLDAGTP